MNRQYHPGKYYDYASFLVSVEEVEGETFDEWVKAKSQNWEFDRVGTACISLGLDTKKNAIL